MIKIILFAGEKWELRSFYPKSHENKGSSTHLQPEQQVHAGVPEHH